MSTPRFLAKIRNQKIIYQDINTVTQGLQHLEGFDAWITINKKKLKLEV